MKRGSSHILYHAPQPTRENRCPWGTGGTYFECRGAWETVTPRRSALPAKNGVHACGAHAQDGKHHRGQDADHNPPDQHRDDCLPVADLVRLAYGEETADQAPDPTGKGDQSADTRDNGKNAKRRWAIGIPQRAQQLRRRCLRMEHRFTQHLDEIGPDIVADAGHGDTGNQTYQGAQRITT